MSKSASKGATRDCIRVQTRHAPVARLLVTIARVLRTLAQVATLAATSPTSTNKRALNNAPMGSLQLRMCARSAPPRALSAAAKKTTARSVTVRTNSDLPTTEIATRNVHSDLHPKTPAQISFVSSVPIVQQLFVIVKTHLRHSFVLTGSTFMKVVARRNVQRIIALMQKRRHAC